MAMEQREREREKEGFQSQTPHKRKGLLKEKERERKGYFLAFTFLGKMGCVLEEEDEKLFLLPCHNVGFSFLFLLHFCCPIKWMGEGRREDGKSHSQKNFDKCDGKD